MYIARALFVGKSSREGPSYMSLTKTVCGSCGAIFLSSEKTAQKDCNFCGARLSETKGALTDLVIPDAIIPFGVDREAYRKKMFTWLCDGEYTPEDILAESKFSDVLGIYIPIYVFSGTFDGTWAASSGYKRKEDYYETNSEGKEVRKTREVTDWRPSSGSASGTFNVRCYAGGTEGKWIDKLQALGLELECVMQQSDEGLEREFEEESLNGVNMLEYLQGAEAIWTEQGESDAEGDAISAASEMVPGETHKDLHVNMSYHLESTRKVLVPYWAQFYSYKGVDYHVRMVGSEDLEINGAKPEDKDRKSAAKKLFYPAHISAGVVVVVGLVALLISQVTGIVLLLVGAGIVGGIYWKANKSKKNFLEASKQKRLKALSVHLASLG